MIHIYDKVKAQIEITQALYCDRPYWQEKAREDVLNTVWPIDRHDAWENAASHILYKQWEMQRNETTC